jgi:hypothetical protein
MCIRTALEHYDKHSTNENIRVLDNVHIYAMGTLGADQGVLWLLDGTHDPISLNASSGTCHKICRAIIQHILFAEVLRDDFGTFPPSACLDLSQPTSIRAKESRASHSNPYTSHKFE